MASRKGKGPSSDRRRSSGNHSIGDSTPGTIGDSEGVLHDQNGTTPAWDDLVEKNTADEDGEEQTELGTDSVEKLLEKT